MTSKTCALIGFFGGALVGGAITVLGIAPSTIAVLMTPLKWLTEGLHPFPSESPANIAVAVPLMFIYWGCLGMILMLLIRAFVFIISKRR